MLQPAHARPFGSLLTDRRALSQGRAAGLLGPAALARAQERLPRGRSLRRAPTLGPARLRFPSDGDANENRSLRGTTTLAALASRLEGGDDAEQHGVDREPRVNHGRLERRVVEISSLNTLSRMLPARNAVSRLTVTDCVGANSAASTHPAPSAPASSRRGGQRSNRAW